MTVALIISGYDYDLAIKNKRVPFIINEEIEKWFKSLKFTV